MSEYCKYCGQAYGDARTLLLNTCTRHPGGRGKHARHKHTVVQMVYNRRQITRDELFFSCYLITI